MASIPLNGTFTQITATQFADLIGTGGNSIKFTDDRRNDAFPANGIRRYNYQVTMAVRFVVPEGYEGAGTTRMVNFTNTQGNTTLTDFASFKVLPSTSNPVSVNYRSGSPATFSEIKQGGIYNEEFDAMAGTPTTRDLYFAVGGTEFLVDFGATLAAPNAVTTTRTYRAFYSGTACEFKEGDQAKSFTFPSPTGGGSGNVSISSMHTGANLSVTWTGNHTHTQNPMTCGQCGIAGWNACTVNQSTYNTALAAANTYANTVNGTVYSYTSASDRQTRQVSSWSAGVTTNTSNIASNARAASGGSGCLHNHSGSCSTVGTPQNPHTHSGGRCALGSRCTDTHSWTIVVSWTVPAHSGCGPCCSHDLPAIEDRWAQEVTFNPFRIDRAMVWKIEQGHLNGLSTITGSTDTVTTQILQGNPTTFYKRATAETSTGGRLRYTVNPNQHDAASWNLGTRTNKCNKQNESWGTGILYNNTTARIEENYHVSNSTAKDRNTAEYREFDRLRRQLVDVTVISDILILQTSSGDQSVLHFEKRAGQVQTQQNFKPVEITLQESWTNNANSAARWTSNHVNRGSYNGNFAAVNTKYNGTGSNGRVATIFDSDPAGSVTRTARPTAPLRIARTGINVRDTLPNAAYTTGTATTFWRLMTNYNPANAAPWFSTDEQPLFGNRAGYIQSAPYSPTHTKINDIVIHNPVSADYAMVLSLDPSRDQRTTVPRMGEFLSRDWSTCPGNARDCEFAVLFCTYSGSRNHTAACFNNSVLICTEPHHTGEHYCRTNPVCYRACNDNSNHRRINTVGLNSPANGGTAGNFINLRLGFSSVLPYNRRFLAGRSYRHFTAYHSARQRLCKQHGNKGMGGNQAN
jgi:hypothetical protein